MSKFNINNFKVGDKVIVNDLLKDWIKKESWGMSMRELIGKTFTISEVAENVRRDTDVVHVIGTSWWIPVQCLDPIEKDETISIKWYKKGKLEK